MAIQEIKSGDALVCAETGKTFVAGFDGGASNYARDSQGNVYSDEGVDIREKREMLDRSKPFCAYISNDGKRLTGWKGNTLGTVIASWPIKLMRRSYTHGKAYSHFRIRDVHGNVWHGRGSPGICIKVRATKQAGG